MSMRFTPPARAAEHCDIRIAEMAVWAATSEEEHAVSMDMDGPRRPKVKDRRPAATLMEAPVEEKGFRGEKDSESLL